MTNGSLSCSRSASRSARRERSAAPRAVTAVVAEPGVGQPRLQAHPFGRPAAGRSARVRARALRCCQSPAASHACASATAASGEASRPARSAAATAAGMSPAAAYARDSSRVSRCSSQAGTDHPDRALAIICAAASPCPSASAAARRHQAGHRPDQLVRADGQGGVQLPEPAARLAQLTPLQVHPGERGERRRVRVRGRRPLLVGGQGRRRLAGQLRGAAQPAAQGLHQREMPEAAGPLVLPARCGRGGHTRIEDAGRLVQTARPQLDGPAAGQHARPDVPAPGQLVRHPADQRLRLGAAAAAAERSPVRRAAARRIIAAASRAAASWSAGRRSSMPSAASSAAAAGLSAGQRPARPRRRPGRAAARSRHRRLACARTRGPGTGRPAAR